MKIALIQMISSKIDIEKNLELSKKFISEATDQGAKILVFPEMSLTGYFDKHEFLKYSIKIDSEYVNELVATTRGEDFTIIFGISELRDEKRYITQIVAENGEIAGCYIKNNVAPSEKEIYQAGVETPIFKKGELIYGITICADIDKESLYEEYADKGCDIVFECASPELYGNKNPRNWEGGYGWWRDNCVSKLGKYSKNNKIKIAVSTQSGRDENDDFPGGGYFFSEKGELVSETKNHEQKILIIDI